ncbi:MAG: hypothetical protein QXS68_05220 [Candidatus Methanomethylicaceae archaeon]
MEISGLDFAFVDADDVRAVLDEYLSQTDRAKNAECYLGIIVGSGAIVEGLLTWALLRREPGALKSNKAPKDKQGKVMPLQEWSLTSLINVAAELGLIGKTATQASWALKDFRNFIHPYNLLKQSARPDRALAESAAAALVEIRRSLQGRLQ